MSSESTRTSGICLSPVLDRDYRWRWLFGIMMIKWAIAERKRKNDTKHSERHFTDLFRPGYKAHDVGVKLKEVRPDRGFKIL
jgi:hypothetical protein